MSEELQAVPHLKTPLAGPISQLEKQLLNHQDKIESWLKEQWLVTPPTLYASVDLRNAGYKLAPIDTNLFPAGFNNLDEAMLPLASNAVAKTLGRLYPKAKSILLIPESHTRNPFYFEHLSTLQNIILSAGYEVKLGSLIESLDGPYTVTVSSGEVLSLESLKRVEQRVVLDNFDPCLVVLNHDLSDGIPKILEQLEQPLLPPLSMSWSKRLKSYHFGQYEKVAKEFGELLDLDPWFVNPLFRNCGEINFRTRSGEDCLERHVRDLLLRIQDKYNQYGIEDKPFVMVKADAGTYGMAVMSVSDPADVIKLNRKQRNQMSKTKGGLDVTKVIIQEGVPTHETIGATASAEPVVYMVGKHVVGGFYRVHQEKSSTESLNAPGMQFEKLSLTDIGPGSPNQNRFYMHSVVARLALLASARELLEQEG